MANDLALLPCDYNATTSTQDGGIADQANVIEFSAAAGGGRAAEGGELGDVG